MLAGSIVQVRLERKALSAAVSPTCCSGREQRSKPAHVGSAISMKSTLRKLLRTKRRSLGTAENRKRSQLAAQAIMRLPGFVAGARIALYLPFDGETDTAFLIQAAQRRGVCLYVPVVSDRRHRRLRFYPLTRTTRRGTFGIFVPKRLAQPRSPRWLDLIIVPCVGIGAQGHRLGMGGGFYDRAFAFRRLRRCWHAPRLAGLVFDCQRVDSVFAESGDLRLDFLATESGLHTFL